MPRENRVSALISLAVINEKEPERRLIGIDAAFAEIVAHEMQYIIPHIMFVQYLNRFPALVQKLSYNSPIYFLRMLGIPAQLHIPIQLLHVILGFHSGNTLALAGRTTYVIRTKKTLKTRRKLLSNFL